jgi:uncharacterized protein
MSDLKIVFAGPMGAGKTTAIACLSDIEPLRTEVPNSDRSEADKDTTTVGMDYGEITLADGRKVKLFGTPGQARFAFLRRSVSRNALGAIVLIDNGRPNPLEDLAIQLSCFEELVASGSVVVGIGRLATHPEPSLEQYGDFLATAHSLVPLLRVDVRRREDVLMLLEALLCQIEANESVQ